MKLKIRINIHGIVSVSSASLIEQIKGSAEPMDVEVNEEEHKEKEQPAQETMQEQQQPPEANANSQDAQPNGPAEVSIKELHSERKRARTESLSEQLLSWFYAVCCVHQVTFESAGISNAVQIGKLSRFLLSHFFVRSIPSLVLSFFLLISQLEQRSVCFVERKWFC